MIVQDITEPGVYSSGQPAQTNRDWRKNTVRLAKIGSLFDRVKALEKQVWSRAGAGISLNLRHLY